MYLQHERKRFIFEQYRLDYVSTTAVQHVEQQNL